MILKEVSKCLSCLNPLCEKGCPLHNHIRDFIKALKEDDLLKAQRILNDENPFAAITCRVCNYQAQCMGHCVKGIKGESIQIPEIEKYISETLKLDLNCKESNGQKVALVGAGVANLTIAYYLVKEGYDITVFERNSFLGGTIVSGIPEFRFKHAILDELLAQIQKLPIKFVLNTSIGKDIELKELQAQYDYVVLGIGATDENRMRFSGSEKILSGLELLYDLNINKNLDYYRQFKKALVIGGGNVAMDCARFLSQVADTTIMYRRSEKEMPATFSEVEETKEAGVHFALLQNIKEVILENDQVIGAQCIEMVLGEKDASGRASFSEKEDSDFIFDCDLIVMAIGQRVNLSAISSELTDAGYHFTNFENVYVVGDAYLGPKTVAHAIGDAKEVMRLIQSGKESL